MAFPPPFSRRLALSYILDWVVIIGIALVAVGFYEVTGNQRPFSPVDPSISFPHVEDEKISSAVLVILSVIVPGVITALVALVVTPKSTSSREADKAQVWKSKLWEWNTAWMGLGLGLGLSFFFTEGLKDLIGKPRPDLLARCNLDPAMVEQYSLGGYGSQLPLWNHLVSVTACRQPDTSMLNDGFASFPSGHSSLSWAGMLYLALYFCSKFSITIPYLLPYSFSTTNNSQNPSPASAADDDVEQSKSEYHSSPNASTVPLQRQAAAPPAYLFVVALIPISIATYIAGTRYSDFRHHGFDIISGSLIGIASSSLSFRIYYPPIRRGGGWSWGPRGVSKAFGIGMGVQTYAEVHQQGYKRRDLEAGPNRQSTSEMLPRE